MTGLWTIFEDSGGEGLKVDIEADADIDVYSVHSLLYASGLRRLDTLKTLNVSSPK